MTTTLSALRTIIADNIMRSDLNSQIDKSINYAITFFMPNRFTWNETTGTFNTVAAQKSYGTSDSLPSDILEIDSLKLVNSSTNYYPKPITYQQIEKEDWGNYSDIPVYYCYYNSKIYFYPIPAGVYAVTLSYLKSYSALSSDSDHNDFTDNATKMIEQYAMGLVFQDILRNNDQADRCFSMASNEYERLRNQHQRLIGTGSVTATTW